MIFTPQNHQTKLIRSTELNYRQQTGTVAHENQKPYSRPSRKTMRNDQLMPSDRVELKVFGVNIVEVTPQKKKPRKDRNRKNKWGERSKDWRREPYLRLARMKDSRLILGGLIDMGENKAPSHSYRQRRECNRTEQALREWQEGDVNPLDSFWPADWYEDCDLAEDGSCYLEYMESEERKRVDAYWGEMAHRMNEATHNWNELPLATFGIGKDHTWAGLAARCESTSQAIIKMGDALKMACASFADLISTEMFPLFRTYSNANQTYANPQNKTVPALSKRQVKSRQRRMNSRSGRGKR